MEIRSHWSTRQLSTSNALFISCRYFVMPSSSSKMSKANWHPARFHPSLEKRYLTRTLHVKDIDQCIDQLLSEQKFFANSKFILNNGGLGVVTSLHSLLLKQIWDQICHVDLQHLERQLLTLLKAVYSAIPCHSRYEVITYLSNILGSFLRVPISSGHISVPHNRYLPVSTGSGRVLVDILCGALYCLLP